MTRILSFLSVAVLFLTINAFGAGKPSNEPDSVYLFSYSANGLRFAWSHDKENWTPIGNGHIYLKSDYGRWGTEKKMNVPYLIQGRGGEWQVVWNLNDYTLQFAHASSKNLVNWGPQSYPYVTGSKNVLRPIITYNKPSDIYTITYSDKDGEYFQTTTKDFKTYAPVTRATATQYENKSVTVHVGGVASNGQLHRVAWPVVQELIKAYELQQFKSRLNAETTKDDAQRFAGLKPVDAKIVLQPQKAKPISNMLMGVFFEDINYAADGGLYAELVQNRGFEYHPKDKSYRDRNWNHAYAWSLKGEGATFRIDSTTPLHPNNPHYAVLEVSLPGAVLMNIGFGGIAVKKGEAYNFSAFIQQLKGKGGVEVRLVSDKQGVLATAKLTGGASSWKNVKATLTASADATDGRLELQPLYAGAIAFDMISLFPQSTFMGRKNGLRPDLAKAIADIRPRFIRFPGGCVAHGDGIDNIYRWKNSIGPLEARKPDRNLWGYHQTMGLGYFEYFQFCEDIGAEPVPVVAAGVPCQNSGTGGGGQQGGIPMSEMDEYIQDILDLIEYANGDTKTTWGRKRAAAGHPKPFNLKYIGIGNEDQITEVFRERFEMIYNAVRKAYPEITVIGTAGPFFEGTDYEEGWKIANNLNVEVIDEHYYQSPGWFIHNQDFYDRYDRKKSKVYLGEYAASLPGGNKTYWETSLAEALYLTSLERNGDIVSMTSYAPLLGKEGHTQWNPDLIYFNNSEIKPTAGYYVQQLYGQNAGDQYIPATISLSNTQDNVGKRIAYSVVKDSKTNELAIKLVNILPVAVNTSIDFGPLLSNPTTATKTLLAGNPAERDVKPVVASVPIANKAEIELTPYSFTVLRFKSN